MDVSSDRNDLEARVYAVIMEHLAEGLRMNARLEAMCCETGMPRAQATLFLMQLTERALKQLIADHGVTGDVHVTLDGDPVSKPRLIPV